MVITSDGFCCNLDSKINAQTRGGGNVTPKFPSRTLAILYLVWGTNLFNREGPLR